MNIKIFLNELIEEGIKPVEEEYEYEYFLFKNPILKAQSKKIRLIPISFGYNKEDRFESEFLYLREFLPNYVFDENLKEKILYIHKINSPKDIHFLQKIKPSLVITNSDIKRPIYSPDFPIFFLPSFLKENEINIKFKIKKRRKKFKNIYFDIGRGPYLVIINLPFDTIFDRWDEIGIYASFQLLKELVKKFLTVKYPRGYRIRIILSDLRYSDYYGLKFHLKNLDPNNILSIFNIENTGLGNEKLILKNRRNLLDSFHYKKIKKISEKGNYQIEEDNLKDFSSIDDIKLPIIWFASQPNDNIYRLEKEFLNRNLILNQANYIFFLINHLYKGNA